MLMRTTWFLSGIAVMCGWQERSGRERKKTVVKPEKYGKLSNMKNISKHDALIQGTYLPFLVLLCCVESKGEAVEDERSLL